MISEGFLRVRESNRPTEEQIENKTLSEEARTQQRGVHNEVNKSLHVRNVTWTVDNPRHFVDAHHQKPIPAVVEQVVNGSTFRAFLFPSDISPTYQYVTLLLSGVRAPSARPGEDKETYEDEAKFFVESRLLQRDVQIVLEGVSNNNIVGTVLHPNGNIAEILLREGFARCVDWSMTMVSQGPEKYRAAEKVAKDKRLRLWKDFSPSGPTIDSKEKNFVGKVVEVVNSDALVLKLADGSFKKVFLASVRPPRIDAAAPAADDAAKALRPAARSRPLYDIPYMFEAREFLRKKLIGKKVNVTLDYIQPAADNFPLKNACTVMLGGQNIAEALVSKGYCTVVRYRQDDDQRGSHYDELLAAESKAEKKGLGIHSKKPPSPIKVSDISGDSAKAKQFLPFLQRAGRLEALVEFIASGSRVRVYIPRETCLITFLLSGISCPRAERVLPQERIPGEPYGEQALLFTKEHILQREVDIEVESMDKGGNFIGYLFTKESNDNLSELLVREGLASVHFTAEKGNYLRQLQTAEESAKEKKLNLWENYVPEVDTKPETEGPEDGDSAVPERKVNYQPVVITEVSRETLNFFAQFVDDGQKLEKLMEEVNQELKTNPPLPGAYTPKRGELCAAKFEDGFWYRAKVEKSQPNSKTVPVFYVDYGNKAQVAIVDSVASLPARFSLANTPAFAHEFGLACVAVPPDEESKADAFRAIAEDVTSASQILLNVEYESNGVKMASILNASNKEDVAKGLIGEGFLLVDKERKERRLQPLLQEYLKGQEDAKKARLNLWRYGDFTDDDAREFGMTAPNRR